MHQHHKEENKLVTVVKYNIREMKLYHCEVKVMVLFLPQQHKITHFIKKTGQDWEYHLVNKTNVNRSHFSPSSFVV